MLSPTLDEQLQIVLSHVQLVHTVRLHTRDSMFRRLGLRYRRRFLDLLLYTRYRILLGQPGMISALLGHHTFAEIFDSFFVKMIPIGIRFYFACLSFLFVFYSLSLYFFLSISPSLSHTHTRIHAYIVISSIPSWAGSVQLFVVFSTMEMWAMKSRVCFLRWNFLSFENRASIIEKRYDGSSLVVFWFFFFLERRQTKRQTDCFERNDEFISSLKERKIEIVRSLIRKNAKIVSFVLKFFTYFDRNVRWK